MSCNATTTLSCNRIRSKQKRRFPRTLLYQESGPLRLRSGLRPGGAKRHLFDPRKNLVQRARYNPLLLLPLFSEHRVGFACSGLCRGRVGFGG
eukprot:1621204-Rhodomonas_salina.1